MSCKICDATNGITLDFDIWTEHLANQRLQSTQFHNQKFVLR